MSHHTLVQSVPGRAANGDRASGAANSSTQDQRASSTTFVERVGATLSKLLKAERKVGKAPGFTRELRMILFGSCMSRSLTSPSASDLTRSDRA